MLLAAGAVLMEQGLALLRATRAWFIRATAWVAFAVSGALFAAIALPIAPVNSEWWNTVGEINSEFKEEIGWPELVQTVAEIYAALPAQDKPQAGILTGNYGEAGAINLYGPAYGLPKAISGINSYWLRGYGDPPPQTLIVLGWNGADANRAFESCQVAGSVTNRYAVRNEETRDHPIILLCRGPREAWPELWKRLRSFG
jgi:hypothetical protein